MTDRFSPLAILKSALGSLRRRSLVGRERFDKLALVVLLVLPLVVGVASVAFGWVIRDAAEVTAGFALLAGSLLSAVPQLASWRQRLTDRNRAGDGIARRSLDEAVSNTLVAVLCSVLLAGLSVVLGNISEPDPGQTGGVVIPWVARILTGLFCAGAAYLFFALVLLVNLIFDAYQDANAITQKAQQRAEDDRWRDNGAA